jgi:hypothetical protein
MDMRRAATVLVPAILLVLPAAAPAQEQVLARLDAATPVAAYRGVVAWSQRDPATGRFALMTNRGPAPVAQRGVPFDVDLGPAGGGRVAAVYSRCRRESGVLDTYGGLYARLRGCDIFRLDLTTGRETRLAASAPRADEVWPTIWRSTYAFARTYDRRRGVPYVYMRRRGRTVRVPGGPRGQRRRSRPMALELEGLALAFGWSYQGDEETPASELRVDFLGAPTRRTVYQRYPGGGLVGLTLSWPAFGGGFVHWATPLIGEPTTREGLWRSPLARAAPRRRPAPGQILLSHDRDGSTEVLLVDRSGVGDCKGDPPVAAGTCELLSRPG